MTTVVAQIRATQHGKKNKYEYDSDEDTEGGTWEHKIRSAEMQATKGYFVDIIPNVQINTLISQDTFCMSVN